MKYDVVDINYNANDLVGIVGDKTIHLSGYVSEKKYKEPLNVPEPLTQNQNVNELKLDF